MSRLKLPRLISDGMVLQHGKPIHIWGFDAPGKEVKVVFRENTYAFKTDEDGVFSGYMEPLCPGGPYTLLVEDEDGASIQVKDVLVGEVYFCSGQSNMELPMARVKDRFPKEVASCENRQIRTFKIIEHGEFIAPLTELQTGEWVSACPETILAFSATAYFFAYYLNQTTGLPIGFINASLGGSRLETWLSKEMIEGEVPYVQVRDIDLQHGKLGDLETRKEEIRQGWLAEMERYADEEFVAAQLAKNERQSLSWHQALDEKDKGLSAHWEKGNWSGDIMNLPRFFEDTALEGFIGSVWFKKTFAVPEALAGKPMHLWLGTIVDSDTAYVNGVQVGSTPYQYPPRKYEIPEGLLVEGENTLVLRVLCENGQGRFTIGKRYAIWSELGEIDLQGAWTYQIGATAGQIPPNDMVNWKPTVLYNGMTAPCHRYTIGGMVWYQGESNATYAEVYLDGLKRLVGGYRRMWKDESLPFYYVQLPNFTIDSPGAEESGWRELREKQRMAQEIPGCYMAVAIDLGEDNDLHPLNKKEIGRRLALLAAEKTYRHACLGESPVVRQINVQRVEQEDKTCYALQLLCEHVGAGLSATSEDKGSEIRDFQVIDEDGKVICPEVCVKENVLCLHSEEMVKKPVQVRYCYADTNEGALIYNSYQLPMSPFIWQL